MHTNTDAASSYTIITFQPIATLTTTTDIMSNGMTMKIIGNIEEEFELNQSTVRAFRLSKGHINSILGRD